MSRSYWNFQGVLTPIFMVLFVAGLSSPANALDCPKDMSHLSVQQLIDAAYGNSWGNWTTVLPAPTHPDVIKTALDCGVAPADVDEVVSVCQNSGRCLGAGLKFLRDNPTNAPQKLQYQAGLAETLCSKYHPDDSCNSAIDYLDKYHKAEITGIIQCAGLSYKQEDSSQSRVTMTYSQNVGGCGSPAAVNSITNDRVYYPENNNCSEWGWGTNLYQTLPEDYKIAKCAGALVTFKDIDFALDSKEDSEEPMYFQRVIIKTLALKDRRRQIALEEEAKESTQQKKDTEAQQTAQQGQKQINQLHSCPVRLNKPEAKLV